jgi:hypothetical protein
MPPASAATTAWRSGCLTRDVIKRKVAKVPQRRWGNSRGDFFFASSRNLCDLALKNI